MLQQYTRRFGVVAAIGLALAVPSQAFAQNLQDWQAMGGTGAIQSFHSKFTLYNVTDKEALKYGSRFAGINLKWDKSTSLNNVRFDKQTGSGDVLYGELIGINISGGGFLRHQKRPVGINLGWSSSSSPVYEWRIAGGVEGTPVKFGDPIALYNETAKDFVVYGSRPGPVINLIWLKDHGKGLFDRAKDAAKGPIKDFIKKKLGS